MNLQLLQHVHELRTAPLRIRRHAVLQQWDHPYNNVTELDLFGQDEREKH